MRNARHLGVPDLSVVTGHAPAALQDLPQPDAIFIGGGASEDGVFDACWSALKSGGRLVVNAVTLETERVVYERHGEHGGIAQAHRTLASRTCGRHAWLALRDAGHAMVGGEAMIVAGVGFRSGATCREIVELVSLAADEAELSRGDFHCLATLDARAQEAGFIEAANDN